MKPKYLRDGRAPLPKSETVSKVMSAIRAKNTQPELILGEMLIRAKVKGFRRHLKGIPGRPDFAFPKKKVAVFVHGCFWHGCPYCKLPLPKTHRAFWKNKIETNNIRDKRKNRELRKLGWLPVTVWACRLKTDRGRARILLQVNEAFNSAR